MKGLAVWIALALGVGAGGLRPPPEAPLQQDLRVIAFLRAYEALVDSIQYVDGDVVFAMGEDRIHFRGGRMLNGRSLDRAEACDPIFYRYPLGPLRELPPPPREDDPVYCPDLPESLWGSTEREIRSHGRRTTFLGHRMFVNKLVVEALAEVERDLLAAARTDEAVSSWIDELEITYSFISRGIAGSENRSQHGWGMAVDFVPASYEGRHVYWRWSRVFDREEWHRIPLDRRWTPPAQVVAIFERHGFVWGGKWTHFDNIHFEYRPEILLYNQLALRRGVR